jgi:hypothetical protein
LIAVHECGHWFFGRLAGIPSGQMRIRLFTFPQQVQLRDADCWISVSTFDKYFERLRCFVPSETGQFVYVVGGFVFETTFLAILTIMLGLQGFWLYAIVAPGISLTMYLVYVFAMDIPQSKSLGKPWGDSTILFSLAPGWAIGVAVGMIVTRIGLILLAATRIWW